MRGGHYPYSYLYPYPYPYHTPTPTPTPTPNPTPNQVDFMLSGHLPRGSRLLVVAADDRWKASPNPDPNPSLDPNL